MTNGLLLAPADVATRRAIVAGPLAALARSLADDLAPLVARATQVAPADLLPLEKARMTRIGGRCRVDTTLLLFDPWSPHRHTCPLCGREYSADEDYRWWIMWYQLWLAERAVHGAALALLAGDEGAGMLARHILEGCATRYLDYPNVDNALGPTRPFFSTYLESIWLLQLCMALDLVEMLGSRDDVALGQRVRERVIAPSRALIASYDEGRSNRQVWNAAALAAAARLLGDAHAVERATLGTSGLASHLAGGLLSDGTWYEGENYHQFAHRGLWYGVTLAEHAGIALPPELVRRFDAGFVAPFLTALPDLTFPARRDSQWAVSLRQWRYAESCELGLARRDDEPLAGALAALYDPAAAVPRRDTGRARSAAESERNEPATRLSRADVGWRALLCARAELPNVARWAPVSVHLPAQGLAVFRRDAGKLWVALDYGHSGGSHGHPDRLDLLLTDGAQRWLDDMGTGSYVDRSLHWYRSTLAHNAPLVNGRSQSRVDGRLIAYDEQGDRGWLRATAPIAPGVDATRTLVVSDDYIVDRLEWSADREVELDLPMHVDASLPADTVWRDDDPRGSIGQEDGFDFLSDVQSTSIAAGRTVSLRVDVGLRAWAAASTPAVWFRATAPGAPGKGMRRFVWARMRGHSGAITSVWCPRGTVANVAIDGTRLDVTRVDGRRDAHASAEDAWTIDERGPKGGRVVQLGGAVDETARAVVAPSPRTEPTPLSRDGTPIDVDLGEMHYWRSESTWHEAGSPRANARIAVRDGRLDIDVALHATDLTFVRAGATNPLDNERAETNGHGVQLYLQPGGDHAAGDVFAWLLVPDGDVEGQVRVLAVPADAPHVPIDATWARTRDGFALRVRVPVAAIEPAPPAAPIFGLDVIVNDATPERERRRGQLVLSGARGDFVYLRGDRHDPARFVRLRLVP